MLAAALIVFVYQSLRSSWFYFPHSLMIIIDANEHSCWLSVCDLGSRLESGARVQRPRLIGVRARANELAFR